MMGARQPIRVLIVDDSAMFRAMLARALRSDPEIEITGSVGSAAEAREYLALRRPDVVTLDIEMPVEDGLSLLRDYMARDPVPTVVVSGRTRANMKASIAALEGGAVDVVEKPTPRGSAADPTMFDRIIASVKAAHGARLQAPRQHGAARGPAEPPPQYRQAAGSWVIAIGASTGGVQALGTLLPALPADAPPVVIVQHMPKGFTAAFARRLNDLCRMEVREAEDGDILRRGLILIAPGGERHMTIEQRGGQYRVRLIDGEPICYSRPSVDVLFGSLAPLCRGRVSAAILTGMGRDGAVGLRALRDCGGRTFAQDEATSEIFGMPARAQDIDACERLLPLERLADALLASVGTIPANPPKTTGGAGDPARPDALVPGDFP